MITLENELINQSMILNSCSKLGLIILLILTRSEAKSLRQQLGKTSHALALADAEHSKMESYTIAAANDLLQKMQAMLNELKKKIGFQVCVCRACTCFFCRFLEKIHKMNILKI